LAHAQCNGVFASGTVCGKAVGSSGIPGPLPLASFALSPGGSNGQVQYNNAGGLGGYTNTQLTALINAVTATLPGAIPAFPNNTTTFFRGDGTYAVPTTPPIPPGSSNLIINGSAQIDQIYEGTQNTFCDGSNSALPGGATTTEIYVLDNWRLGCDSGSGRLDGKRTVLANQPPGLQYFVDLKVPTADTSTTSTNNYHLEIPISGDRISALQFGTASASSVTCQFNMAASAFLSGSTFGIGLVEGVTDAQGVVETFTYTGGGALQNIVVTFPGATTGTWSLSPLQIGAKIIFDLGSGSQFQASSTGVWTTGPKFTLAGLTRFIAQPGGASEIFINGLQCDPGTVALPYRFVSFNQDLADCQAFVYKTFPIGVPVSTSATVAGEVSYIATTVGTATGNGVRISYPTQNAVLPIFFTFSPGGGGTDTKWRNITTGVDSGGPTVVDASSSSAMIINPQLATDNSGHKIGLHVVVVSRTGTF